jgi:hypothetical protein
MSNGAQWAKEFARYLVEKYPDKDNVQDLIEIAKANGHFDNEVEMLSVWGRVCRLLPQKEINK